MDRQVKRQKTELGEIWRALASHGIGVFEPRSLEAHEGLKVGFNNHGGCVFLPKGEDKDVDGCGSNPEGDDKDADGWDAFLKADIEMPMAAAALPKGGKYRQPGEGSSKGSKALSAKADFYNRFACGKGLAGDAPILGHILPKATSCAYKGPGL